MLGLSNVVLNRYEQDERRPDPGVLADIANAYGVSADWLLGLTDDPSGVQRNVDDRPIPEADLDAYLRQHDLWFKGQPLIYAEKLAARQAIELLRKAMEASKDETREEDQEGES